VVLTAPAPLLSEPPAEDVAKQLETVGLIRDLGGIWFGWLVDQLGVEWPGKDPGPIPEDLATGGDGSGGLRFDLRGTGRPITHEEFLELVSPWVDSEMEGDPAEIPTHDAWGHPLEFRFRWDVLKQQVMSIRSPGRDGVFSEPVYSVGPHSVDDVDADIVWADGFFVSYPEGLPKEVMDRR